MYQIVNDLEDIKGDVQKMKDAREIQQTDKLKTMATALITFASGVITPLVVWAITR